MVAAKGLKLRNAFLIFESRWRQNKTVQQLHAFQSLCNVYNVINRRTFIDGLQYLPQILILF